MLSAQVVCCIYLLTLLTDLSIEADHVKLWTQIGLFLKERNSLIWVFTVKDEAPPGGVCAPLIPENNALISPDPWK